MLLKADRVLGVDPGITGALALVTVDGHADVWDMPTIGGSKKTIAGPLLADIIKEADVDICMLERVHAMPKQGVVSSFNFGVAFGIAQGIVTAMDTPIELITPQSWKRHYKLKADKEDARRMAIQLFPKLAGALARKKDADRAEALLMANYGLVKSYRSEGLT